MKEALLIIGGDPYYTVVLDTFSNFIQDCFKENPSSPEILFETNNEHESDSFIEEYNK